ncbi:hypothetical protein FRB98_009315, partial [Tulasnella sp. 332]
ARKMETKAEDIETYLQEALSRKFKGFVDKALGCPEGVRRGALIILSQDLPAWAGTVVLVITDPAIRNPESQLVATLSSPHRPKGQDDRKDHLDDIYAKILHRVCPRSTNTEVLTDPRPIDPAFPSQPDMSLLDLFCYALGGLIAVQDPVNIHTLAPLLCPGGYDIGEFTRKGSAQPMVSAHRP